MSFTGVRGLMQLTEDTAALMRRRRPPRSARQHLRRRQVPVDACCDTVPRRIRGARPHVVRRGRLQRGLRPRRGRARPRAAGTAATRTAGRTCATSCRC
ncbi:MAG: hypothetical protein MZW92_09795 [Comamonadaceae bacterium]|nr:hypothetical protein [Comamonadaceae bacterium]